MNKKIEYWESIAECIITEQMAPDGIAKNDLKLSLSMGEGNVRNSIGK